MNGLTKWPGRLGMVLGIAAALLGPIGAASADDLKPLEPGARAYGLTLGEWSAAYFQWAASIPSASNPNTVTSRMGQFAGIGQRMPVWFLPSRRRGTGALTYSCAVPAGYSVLFPVALAAFFQRPGQASEEALQGDVASYKDMGQVTRLEVTLDGVAIPDLQRYRVQSPLFTVVLPPGNILGFEVTEATGTRMVGAADGYWLLLPPLPAGRHVIQKRSEGPYGDGSRWKEEFTYEIVVVGPNDQDP
jgi:hypothetical protein